MERAGRAQRRPRSSRASFVATRQERRGRLPQRNARSTKERDRCKEHQIQPVSETVDVGHVDTFVFVCHPVGAASAKVATKRTELEATWFHHSSPNTVRFVVFGRSSTSKRVMATLNTPSLPTGGFSILPFRPKDCERKEPQPKRDRTARDFKTLHGSNPRRAPSILSPGYCA